MVSSKQAQHVLAAFASAVTDIAQRPESLVLESRLFGSLDAEQLTAWNAERPAGDFHDGCLHDLLRETSLRQPMQPAVSAWDGELTYEQLDHLSDALGARIVVAGIRPEEIVALCFEKSLWAVVAMVAVVKSGGECTFRFLSSCRANPNHDLNSRHPSFKSPVLTAYRSIRSY